MSSTFKEQYDDFIDKVKHYTEKLDITPVSFMRLYTRGVQDFQRKTRMVQIRATITKNSDGEFPEPTDMLYLHAIRDENNMPIEHRDNIQLDRMADRREAGFYGDPVWYDRPLLDGGYIDDHVTVATIRNRRFEFYPTYTGNSISVDYVPDFPAFSQNTKLWYPSQYGGSVANDWFPIESYFETKFRTWTVHPDLSPYEYTCLQFAIGDWIMSYGHPSYQAFRQAYDREVAYALQHKPNLFRGGMSPYVMAPNAI